MQHINNLHQVIDEEFDGDGKQDNPEELTKNEDPALAEPAF